MRRGQCQLRDTVPPTLVRLTRRALEGGRRSPRTGACAFFMTTQDYTVTSGRRERSSLSLSALCGHPCYCSTTLDTVTTSPTLLKRTRTEHRHDRHCTSHGLPLTPPSSQPADDGRTTNLYATTLEVAPVRAQDSPRRPDRSGIRQDNRQLRDTARHAFTRRRMVQHACKLLSLAYKRRGNPPAAGGTTSRDERHSHAFGLPLRYCHLPQSVPLGPRGPASSPTSLVAPLCKHHDATQYSAPSTPLVDVQPRPEPG
jgi:hypothetical protein